MATDFTVNRNDLEFILRQIDIAEEHARLIREFPTTDSAELLKQAIQTEYSVTLGNAGILPYGLRTVDGRDNNLLVDREYGASNTIFPRLTDPVYTNENDENGFPLGPPGSPLLTNTNYAGSGNVVDSDPRTISNLIVDQTPANPAAILAALKVAGTEGAAATAAQGAISAAYAATIEVRGAASAAVNSTFAALTAAGVLQGQRALEDEAADAAVASLDAAVQIAGQVRTTANGAVTALNALITHVNTLDPCVPAGPDIYNAAVTAAQAALDAANNVLNELNDAAKPVAQAVADAATVLLADLTLLAIDGVDSTDAGAITAARNTYDDVTGANGLAQQSANDLAASLAAANNAATTAQNLLDDATDAAVLAQAAYDTAVANNGGLTGPIPAADAALSDLLEAHGLEQGPEGGLFIKNLSPDIGLSPSFSQFMTIFGQFFDHGLDLVTKENNGTVYIPLQPDDPLIAGADGLFETTEDNLPAHLRFMALTRAGGSNGEQTNLTTSFVDQNQTYTSNSSHQAFLREYVRVDDKSLATGHLLDGARPGSIANWAEVKAHALEFLGIKLDDSDVFKVPQLLVDPYGNLILGENGYAQMVTTNGIVEGTAAGVTTANAVKTQFSFLLDIAHNAVPGGTPGALPEDDDDAVGYAVGVDARGRNTAYDDELLDSHFATGDGRGNENIALTAVHAVFHSEHNRLVEDNKATILATNDRAFINDWLLDGHDLPAGAIPTNVNDPSLVWDGARLFQAARFVTEMQYQHGVFEEFARAVQPAVNAFVFTNNAEIDPGILAEFAHTVYRFGHSMLDDTVDRLDNELGVVGVNGGDEQITLIDSFLDPQSYLAGGSNIAEIQGALMRGMTRQIGNEIDEFIVPALRSNLLGLPLDLAVLNIARGRETGIPSLNETRKQLYDDFGFADLKPYESWNEFVQAIKNPLSVINFIAAYGNHASLLDIADDPDTTDVNEAHRLTLEERREAAMALVLGTAGETAAQFADRKAFMAGTGIYDNTAAGTDPGHRGGLDYVDLWIGGLAEAKNEFGGMLGSTFNFIFEYQLERLQDGDRLYYLSRTQGLNLLNQLEPNTFADLVMRNSDLGGLYATHLNAHIMVTPDLILELDQGIAQEDYNEDDDDSQADGGFDAVWEDPQLQSIDPKVVRIESDVIGGHTVGGTLQFRGGEHVVLGGTEGDDRLIGDRGIDTLWGDGGHDYLNAMTESDEVFGGDGDDIIEDPFGDNFLRGQNGNDVISAARSAGGLNLLFGGDGKDVLLIGQDAAEVFAGDGDDFILGGTGTDALMGNEGNDWIEGGDSFDGLTGENSELFFNSTIIGHDVLWSQGNDADDDGESGDDIMLGGPGVIRMEGMFGFDWASGKYDSSRAPIDLFRGQAFPTDQDDVLRDRFDKVEGASGWKLDDVINGDDRGSSPGVVTPINAGAVDPAFVVDAGLLEDELLNENVDLIDGLRTWFGDVAGTPAIEGARATLFGDGTGDVFPIDGPDGFFFSHGNILMGGGGSDTLHGRGGFDVIDGDAWLNVRIKVMVGDTEYSAESLNTDTTVAGPTAGRLTYVSGPNAGQVAFDGRSLQSLLLDRTVRPGDMSVVREILSDASGTDKVVFFGSLDEYDIEGRDTGPGGVNSADVNGDGFITVHDNNPNNRPARQVDDTDLIKVGTVEEFVFLNGGTPDAPVPSTSFDPNGSVPVAPTLAVTDTITLAVVQTAANVIPGVGATIGTLSEAAGAAFSLAAGTAGLAISTTGVVTATTAFGNDQTRLLDAIVTSGGVSTHELITIQSGSGAVDTFIGANGALAVDEVFFGRGGNDSLSMGGGDDTALGQNGNDVLSGGGGRDTLFGGAGADNLKGDAAADTLEGGDGNDILDGGAGRDTMAGGMGNDTYVVDVSNDNVVEGLDAGTDTVQTTVNYTLAANVENLLLVGPGLIGIGNTLANTITGTSGNNTLSGLDGNDTLNGGSGNDDLNGGAGGDILTGGLGTDTINTGAPNDNIADIIRFTTVDQFGDTVTNFDTSGTLAQVDRVDFGGALNAALDDGNNNNNFLFVTSNAAAAQLAVTVGQADNQAEALLLTAGHRAIADITLAGQVATAFNQEFVITAANGEDALLVANNNAGTAFTLWHWTQAGGGEVAAGELQLIGSFAANGSVTANSFDFF